MGENVGQPGNKITGFAQVRAKGAKAARNVPQPVDVSDVVPAASVDDDKLPF
jgi:hypothetical protein